jgi:K+:H+ antiporter
VTRRWRGPSSYALVVILPFAMVLLMLAVSRLAGPTAVSHGSPPPGRDLDSVLVAIVVVLVTAHVCGAAARRLRQPRVVGEMVGGILLGPSGLGALSPGLMHTLFPAEVLSNLDTLAQLGVSFFMFQVGLELDLRVVRETRAAALVIGHGAMAVPFAAGVLLGLLLPSTFLPVGIGRLPLVLFTGLSLSVTALPVLARIIGQRGMTETPIGALGLAAAGVGDVTAWCLLALVLALSDHTGIAGVVRTAALTIGFAALMLSVVRPLLSSGLAWIEDLGPDRHSAAALCTCLLLTSALITQQIGVRPILGALLAGAVTPRRSSAARELVRRTEGLTTWLLLPLFFATAGLAVRTGMILGAGSAAMCALVLLMAAAGKVGGAAAAARLMGRGGRESLTLGVMMNCRGLTELVLLTAGLSHGLITPAMYSVLLATTVVTTAATNPLLDLLEVPSPGGRQDGHHEPPPPSETAVALLQIR